MSGRHSRLASVALLSTLGLWGCSTPAEDQETLELPTVAGSFEVFETRRPERTGTKPRGTLVDYDSQLTVRVDRAHLARTVGADADADADLQRSEVLALDSELQELERQLALVEELRPVLKTLAEYEQETQRFFKQAAEPRLLLQEDPRWRSLRSQQLDVVGQLKTLIQTYVNYASFEGRFDWQVFPESEEGPEAERFLLAQDEFNALYSRLAPTPETYDAQAVSELLNDCSQLLGDCVEEIERTVLAKAPKARLEMEAKLLRDRPLNVTISPYSIVEGVGRGGKSARIGLPSKADMARVKAGYEAHAELADTLNKLKELAEDDAQREALIAGLLTALKESAERLSISLEADLNALLELPGAELKPLKDQARALRKELRELLRSTQDLADLARELKPLELTRQALALLERLRSSSLPNLIQGLVTSIQEAPANLSADAKQLLEDAKGKLEREREALLKALANQPGTGQLAGLFDSLRKLHALSNTRSFGELKPTKITRTPFSIDVAQDASVDLANTPAEAGDQLQILYKVVANPEAEEANVREYHSTSLFDIRKFGFYTTFESQIIFYERLGDASSSFRAAPGIGYNLHYRPESAQGFHDLVAPGLGLSVSSPSFEDGTELAVGLQLTLFNDLLQTGYAYNISVDQNPGMYYFGLDLIQAFQNL